MRVKAPTVASHVALLSAASGAETSGPNSGGTGLFTQYVLDGLGRGKADINGDGQVSAQELAEWVTPRVSREAKKDNRDQTPNLIVGSAMGAPTAFILAWGFAAN